jgi:hypothetical protein
MRTVEVYGVEPLATPSAPVSVSVVGRREGGVLGVRGVGVVVSGPVVVHSSGVTLEVGAHETAPPNKGLQLTGGRFHRRQRSLRRPQLNPSVRRTHRP